MKALKEKILCAQFYLRQVKTMSRNAKHYKQLENRL